MPGAAQQAYDDAVKHVEAARKRRNDDSDKAHDLNTRLTSVIIYCPEDMRGKKALIKELIEEKEAALRDEEEAWRDYIKAMGEEMRAAKALAK